jgi:hypothetical protein
MKETKFYCDCCGKETKNVALVVLTDNKDYKTSRGELCLDCMDELTTLYDEFIKNKNAIPSGIQIRENTGL